MSQFLPEYSAVSNASVGPDVKKASWTMNNFGVLAEYRGKGIGRALLETGEALVSSCIISLSMLSQPERTIG